MSSTCTPILVGVGSPVSEILLLSKMAKFPWTIVHGHQKIQSIGIGSKNSCKQWFVKYMHTNFGGRGFSGFGDIATFKNG